MRKDVFSESERIELIKELALAFGPSSCEDEVSWIISKKMAPHYEEILPDRMGNLVYRLKGKSSEKRLMISVHMDEVGFMITDIDEKGYLYFDIIGSISDDVLSAKNVVIGDEERRIGGVISSKPIHLLSGDERKKVPKHGRMYIDIGAKDRKDAEQYVAIGDCGVFDTPFTLFGRQDRMIASKALDDRFGCALLIEIAAEMSKSGVIPEYDIYFAFTVREETGYTGALTAANYIEPTHSIVLETTAVNDIDDCPEHKKVAKCGEGGVISLADYGTVYGEEFISKAIERAKEKGIPYQIKKYISGGNDAAKISLSRQGVKTLAISAPCRYLHTASNVLCIDDYCSIKDLVIALAEKID